MHFKRLFQESSCKWIKSLFLLGLPGIFWPVQQLHCAVLSWKGSARSCGCSSSPGRLACGDSCVCVCVCVCVCLRSVVSYSLWPHGLQPARLLCPWNFPGKNTRAGYCFLLQGIFPTQGSNPHLLRLLSWQADSFPPCHLGSPQRLLAGALKNC